MNGVGPADAAACEMAGEIAIVKLPYRLIDQEECRSFAVQIGRLLDNQHCDFLLDFAETGVVSSVFLSYLVRLMKRARMVAEQLGKRVAAPARPLGHGFKMFDGRASAVAEMSKFDGHGWIVFCSVSPVVQEVFMLA